MDAKLFCTHAYAVVFSWVCLFTHTHRHALACLFRLFDRTRLYTSMLFCVAVHALKHSQWAMLFLFTSDAAGCWCGCFQWDMEMMMICVINKCKSTHAPTITSTTKWLCECRHVRVRVGVCSLEMRVICKEIETKPTTLPTISVTMWIYAECVKLYHRFDILRFFSCTHSPALSLVQCGAAPEQLLLTDKSYHFACENTNTNWKT